MTGKTIPHKINLLIIFLITFSFYGYFIRPGDWNITSRLALVKAIVEERRFAIDSYLSGEFYSGDVAFHDGHYYSDKAIGASLLGALMYLPIYGLNGSQTPYDLFIMTLTVMAISLPSAVLAPLLYSTARRMVKENWGALLISLGICLGTPIYPYAGAYYGHSLAAAISFSVFFLWFEVNQFSARISPGRLFLSGFLIGYLILTEYPTSIIAAFLMGYMVYIIRSQRSHWHWKTARSFLAGGAIPLAVFLFYNWVSFGSPWSTGYANEYLPEFNQLRSTAFLGIGWPNLETLLYMTVHPMLGVFIHSPILALSLCGIPFMWQARRFRVEFFVVTLMVFVYFLVNSGSITWWGGDAFTVRYLIPVLPFFGIYLIFLPRKFAPLILGIGLVSLFQMMVASATLYHFFDQYITEILDQGFKISWGTNLLYRELVPKLLRHRLTFSWGHYLFGLESWYFNFAIPIFAGLILLFVFHVINRGKDVDLTIGSSSPM
ncbi:MAG: hypothetical protein FJZ87_08345 [Chloroflexi bacterium]|nr:hypothetical protein [Chloroflexota bacterium]